MKALSFLLLSLWASLAGAANLELMAKRLATLRAEVDDLQQRLEQAKSERRQKLDALGAQITQLQAEKRRQQLAVEKLKAELASLEQNGESTSEAAPSEEAPEEALADVLRRSLVKLREYTQSSLPFKREERIRAIEDLAERLDTGASLPKLANQAWALVEDELRLTRENGLYRQTLNLEGDEALVEVAKLGMVFLYFRTPDDRYGMAVPNDSTWRYGLLSDREDQERLARLMESLRKQIRQGYFELPNPYYR